MPVNLPKAPNQEIRELLEQNLELNEEIFKMVKSIKHYVIGQRIWFVIKILIIVIPITLGAIYLPEILKPFFEQYKSLLGATGAVGDPMNMLNSVDLSSLSPDILKSLK